MLSRLLWAGTFAAAAGACAPMPTGASAERTCHVQALDAVFSSPLAFDGKRFCGRALAYPEGNSVKLFPIGHDLSERYDLVAIPGAEVETALARANRGGPFEIYLEGRIRPHRACFRRPVQPDGTQACLPFRRPINIDVESYRILELPGFV
jgi:hypothetical protein